MGSALAVGTIPIGSNNNLIRNGLAWLGLILILFSLVFLILSTAFSRLCSVDSMSWLGSNHICQL